MGSGQLLASLLGSSFHDALLAVPIAMDVSVAGSINEVRGRALFSW
jgi:hypothetical protein